MFLSMVYGGLEILDKESDYENPRQSQILSVAQDIVYGVSEGKKWTPKHVGLGSTLHQSTRSKKLVTLFHRAGHCLPYTDLLRVDTALAEHSLSTMDKETGNILPVNLTPTRFTHFTADNIDINDSTLDGKDTFHATQVAAWQRGPIEMNVLAEVNASSSEKKLKVPEVMNKLIPIHFIEGKSEPRFKQPVEIETFQVKKDTCIVATEAWCKDMAFHIKRQSQEIPEYGLPLITHCVMIATRLQL